MPPQLAALAFIIGILGLAALDSSVTRPTSKALWIPVFLLVVNGSRSLSEWFAVLGFGTGTSRQSLSPTSFVEGSPLDRNVLLVLIFVSLAILIRRGAATASILRRNSLFILFFLYCGISVFWSDYSFVSFKRWTKGVSDLLLLLLILTDSRPEDALRWVFARTSYLLVPLSVLFVKYYPEIGRSYDFWSFMPIYTGASTTKNELGMLCLVCSLGCFWQAIWALKNLKGSVRNRQLIAPCAIVVMSFWLQWTSHSMTSFACTCIAGFVMAVGATKLLSRNTWLATALGIGIIGATYVSLFSGSGGGLVSAMGKDPTLTGRTNIWKVVLEQAANPFLGAGYETFWTGPRLTAIWAGTMDRLNQAHNGYLEVYLNLGWIGLALLAAIALKGYRNILRSLARNENAASLKLAFFLNALVYNFTEAGFRQTTLVWMSFLIATSDAPISRVPLATQDAIRSARAKLRPVYRFCVPE